MLEHKEPTTDMDMEWIENHIKEPIAEFMD